MTSCPGRRFHPITCVCNPPSSFASFSTKHHSICQLAGPRLRTNRQRFRYHQLSSYFIRASVPAGIALLVTELSPPAALLIGWLPASSYCRRWWWQSSRSRNERLLVLLAWQSPPPSRSPAASGLSQPHGLRSARRLTPQRIQSRSLRRRHRRWECRHLVTRLPRKLPRHKSAGWGSGGGEKSSEDGEGGMATGNALLY